MILFRYLFKDFFKYVLSTVIMCVFLFVLFDFIHKTTSYLGKYNPETKHLLQYYLYQIPNLFMQSLPIGALLASVIVMVLLGRTNEVTAMRAAGMGPLRIGAPIIVGGICLSIMSFVVGEFILPPAAQKMHYVSEVLMEKQTDEQSTSSRWFRHDNTLYNYEDFDPLTNSLTNVKIITLGANFRPTQTLEAKLAEYLPDKASWLLWETKTVFFWQNGTVASMSKKSNMPYALPIEPKKLTRERREPNEMGIRELDDIIKRGQLTGSDVSSFQVERDIKLAFHFASLVVCLIGLHFGYKSERTTETAKGVLLAIAVGISYWFILNTGRALAKRGVLPSLVGAWLANVIIFWISAYQTYRARK